MFNLTQRFLAVLALTVFFLPFASQSQAQIKTVKPLYERLGGYDAIAAVADDFIVRLATDEKLGRFFVGHSLDSQKQIRQHLVDQLCQVTGGPCIYRGRDMKTSHAGLGISEDGTGRSIIW